MDRIVIENIVAHGRHGAFEEERKHSQPFHLSLELRVDLRVPGASDSLHDTVDYAHIYERVVCIVEQRTFTLLERLASEIIDELLSDARIAAATVSIAKPQILDGATPRVVITRERSA